MASQKQRIQLVQSGLTPIECLSYTASCWTSYEALFRNQKYFVLAETLLRERTSKSKRAALALILMKKWSPSRKLITWTVKPNLTHSFPCAYHWQRSPSAAALPPPLRCSSLTTCHVPMNTDLCFKLLRPTDSIITEYETVFLYL